MAEKRSVSWAWNYFTKYGKKNAQCNICNANYSIQLLFYNIKNHLEIVHSDVCDLLTLHSHYSDIENGKIKCNYCVQTYEQKCAFTNMNHHLISKHKVNRHIAIELNTWVKRYRFQSVETCETCKQFNEINSFKLMIHLYKFHNITVPSKFIPASLSGRLRYLFYPDTDIDMETSSSKQQQICSTDYTSRNSRQWVRHYYTTHESERATCNICGQVYVSNLIKSSIKRHVEKEHGIIFNSLQEVKYSITKKEIKCGYCTNFKTYFIITKNMMMHLMIHHNLNKDMTNTLERWLTNQLIHECEACKQFKEYDSFIFMTHLVEVHRVTVPPQLIPTGLPDRLYNLFCPDKNVENIPTSSTNQQPICYQYNLDPSSNYVNTATSSSLYQSNSSTNLGDSDAYEIDLFVKSALEQGRLSDNSNNHFYSDKNIENISTSNSKQQSSTSTIYYENFGANLNFDAIIEEDS